MKFALLLCALAVQTIAQPAVQQGPERPGNLDIRFEPTAKLQTGVEIPFRITVRDSLGKPFIQAKVTLQIELKNHVQTKVYRAAMTDPGVYIAKPIFPEPGDWNVYVEVRRDNQLSARTIVFSVPQ